MSDEADSLDEIVAEFLAERQRGESPDLEAFVRRHPEHAPQLQDALRGAGLMERAAEAFGQDGDRQVLARTPDPEPCPSGTPGEGSGSWSPRDRSTDDFVARVLAELEHQRGVPRHYELEGEIARGGQGAVLAVHDGTLDRKLAMKVALGGGPTEAASAPSRSLARFMEEAQVTAQLDHPGIVPVHELGLDPQGQVYFTMKLVNGSDLLRVFELARTGRQGWTQTRALSVLLKVCEAMAYAHSKGVIHRDLKPSNVMVGKFGEVYVMDWGLARVLGAVDSKDIRIRSEADASLHSPRHAEGTPDSPLVTMDGDVVGTPAFMSPEQARGELEAMGPHSDVYSVGAMLYQLLTGQMPYVPNGAHLGSLAIWARVREGFPEPVAKLAPDVPAELVAICEKAMARDVPSRYPEMGALAEDLRAFLENRVVRAYETGSYAQLRKWVRRNRGLAASVVFGAAAVVVGLVTSLVLKAASDANAARADGEGQAASAARHEVLRLSALQRLEDLTEEAEGLWPAHPASTQDYRLWLGRAEALMTELPDHEQKLLELRRTALPEAGARDWTFADDQDRWWHNQLQKLVLGLRAFADERTGLYSEGTSPEYGWGVQRRLACTLSLRDGFAPGGESAQAWTRALPAIRAAYPGLVLTPQLGLVPIGADPESKLWEFAHLETGTPAVRGEDGRLVQSGETGLVFVLLPGGTFQMGAQRSDPAGPNHDPQMQDHEGPVHAVTLAPFFLSKYEMTQGQWQRFSGRNPSYYRRGDSHPVEQVSWLDCERLLGRLGLRLPSEAQWEYGCRAGTDSEWSYGNEVGSLRGLVNIADERRKFGGWPFEPGFSDGWDVHCPVGTLPPNSFGLHEIHGNVWEWCLDGFDPRFYGQSPARDPVSSPEGSSFRVFRGGSYFNAAVGARSAHREPGTPSLAYSLIGLRPARAIEP